LSTKNTGIGGTVHDNQHFKIASSSISRSVTSVVVRFEALENQLSFFEGVGQSDIQIKQKSALFSCIL